MLNFEGQRVLITGATGGIGTATSLMFARQKATVCICGRSKEKLDRLANEIIDCGGTAKIFLCDLGKMQEIEGLFDTIDAEMGGLEILVCNAGVTRDALSVRMSLEDFEYVLDVNLKSTFVLNREAIRRMMKLKYGRIVNIGSVVGAMGNAGQANYTASKAGIVGLSKSLAIEFAGRGITVNCVAPGFIETPMTDILNDAQRSKILANIPMARMGRAEDVAYSIVFLASREAQYITGQTIHINGGLLMP
ncbi:MAG: 3-oxoacyl-[acyl-carrier-protein] reductase [Rickettsiales bacterium]|jgi:3-oxoacyl-[acyl-carrier protein] reductase|nr:3-oxoacyl-[acyl-carrier-protein] reductase [Rickettsiales bacterium]